MINSTVGSWAPREDVVSSVCHGDVFETESPLPLPWFLCLSFLSSPRRLDHRLPHLGRCDLHLHRCHPGDLTTPRCSLRALMAFDTAACQAPVRHWDESVANLRCSCCTIPHGAPPPAGLGEPGGGLVTVWLREAGLLQDRLNGSRVHHLQLVSCGGTARSPQYLALLGLRTLCIHSSTPRVPYPNQELAIASPNSRSSSSSELDGLVAVTLAAQFPHLPLGAPTSNRPWRKPRVT
ncbi:hypothetical protein CRUP_037791 [Coryphaenoides rupestris]|nr:hypothetical protein CRUP_037791 [Coryphaenoides rupestris]